MQPRESSNNIASHTRRLIDTQSLTMTGSAGGEVAILSPWLHQTTAKKVRSIVGVAFKAIGLTGSARVQFYATDDADSALEVPQNLGYWSARLYFVTAGERDAKGVPAGSRWVTPEFLANGGQFSVDLDTNNIAQVALVLVNGDTSARLVRLRCEVYA